MKKRVMNWCITAILMFAMLAGLFAAPLTAVAEGVANDDETIDYVLILDMTAKAKGEDDLNTRKAAAKMMVDLLPVDNARLAVFMIGNKDATLTKSYHLRADNGHVYDSEKRMQCIYQLWDFNQSLATEQERKSLKGIIDSEFVSTSSSFSDIHCAIYAAIDSLKFWNSQNACIVMVSSEFAAAYQGDQRDRSSSHTMWDDMVPALTSHAGWVFNWFCVSSEGSNNSFNAKESIQKLCKISEGEVSEGSDISVLPEKLASYISKFNGGGADEGQSIDLDSSGKAEVKLPSFVMLTEANVVVTGNGVRNVSVTDGAGTVISKGKNNVWFSKEADPDDGSYLYSAIKMIRPTSGQWTVNVEGKAGTKVYVQAIHTLEPDIALKCNVNSGEYIKVGQKLSFTATFQYAGEDLNCGQAAYENYIKGASLYYTHSSNPDRKVDITNLLKAEGQSYIADFTVEDKGTYNFYFQVESNEFKAGIRHSNPIENITVENHAPVVKGTINDLNDVPVGTRLEGVVNVAEHFYDEDNEKLTYTVICKKDGREADIEYQLESDNFLTIQAPEKGGEYQFEVFAKDRDSTSETLTFALRVVNQGPEIAQAFNKKDQMIANAPQALASMGFLPKEQCRDLQLDLNDYFMDPENLPLRFVIDESAAVDEDGVEIAKTIFDPETNELTVQALHKGQAEIIVHAFDTGDISTYQTLNIVVKGAVSVLLARYWYVLALLALIILIIIVLMISRRVQGRWEVIVEDNVHNGYCSHTFSSLPSSGIGSLKKTEVSLRAIVEAAMLKEESYDDLDIGLLTAKTIVFKGSLGGSNVKFNFIPDGEDQIVKIDGDIDARPGKNTLRRNQTLSVEYYNGANLELRISAELQ